MQGSNEVHLQGDETHSRKAKYSTLTSETNLLLVLGREPSNVEHMDLLGLVW